MDALNLSNMEDFEMNFDKEILGYSKNISNVILFSALNWLDDVSTFTQREGEAWDSIVAELFREYWLFVVDILLNNGQGLTEDDYSNKIKNTIIDIETQYSPDKVSKSKIKSLIQNKLYQSFLGNLKKLNGQVGSSTYRLIVHGVIQEVLGKVFQQAYKQEFGMQKRIYDPVFGEIVESMSLRINDNFRFLINYFKNDIDQFLTVIEFLSRLTFKTAKRSS